MLFRHTVISSARTSAMCASNKYGMLNLRWMQWTGFRAISSDF